MSSLLICIISANHCKNLSIKHDIGLELILLKHCLNIYLSKHKIKEEKVLDEAYISGI